MEQRSIRVWDLPVRLFHWLLLVCVVGAVVSVKLGGGAMQWHGLFGQAIVGLIAFRLVCGVWSVQPPHALPVLCVRAPSAPT